MRITQGVWDVIADFTAIADSLRLRPTHLRELVPTAPLFIGASDACHHGMGGVWFHATDPTHPPIVWRTPFDSRVVAALITADNPSGAISISDLELLAMIAHKDILAAHADLAERTLWMVTDNRAALSWSAKGSSTSVAARAYLLRYNALHQRRYRYVATHDHIAGTANTMADDASWRWDLSSDALLTHFNSSFPQALPWQMHHLRSATHSDLISALFKRRCGSVSLVSESLPPTPSGPSGRLAAAASVWTPAACPPIPSLSFRSLPNACALAPSPPAVTPSGLVPWKTLSAAWARRTPAWGPWILG